MRPHVALDPTEPNGSPPALAVDAQGNGLAIWANDTALRASRFRAVEDWQSTAVGSGLSGASVKLAVDDAGRGIAAWVASGEIRAARFVEAGRSG